DTGGLVAEIEAWDPFYAAYSAGNEMQASLMIFWYTNRRQQRVLGLSLLLDYQPPWDGAVKDAMRYPQRVPAAALEEFVQFWDRPRAARRAPDPSGGQTPYAGGVGAQPRVEDSASLRLGRRPRSVRSLRAQATRRTGHADLYSSRLRLPVQ